MSSMTMECRCTSEYQDALYGDGRRLHNKLQGQKKKGWRCTVCSNEKLTS